MPRLGITRDHSQLTEIIESARSKGIEVIPLPFLKYEFLDYTWPDKFEHKSPDWILFTSANGVKSFFNKMMRLEIEFSKTKFGVVGDKTRTTLEKYGYQAQVVPVLSYGKSLFEEIAQNHINEHESVIYVRAQKISFDPQTMFEKHSIDYNAIIAYRTIRNELSTDSVSSLLEDDAILFTAPSTVKAYQQQFGQPLAKAIAIGDITATAMNEQNWDNIIIMETPDVNKVLEYI
ncbi:uroporphyrinogen-III synthase [Candidatus Zixiibacteriota bacterium]